MATYNRIHLPFETREIPYLNNKHYVNVENDTISILDENGESIISNNGKYTLPFIFCNKEVDLKFIIAFTYIPVYKPNYNVLNWNAVIINDNEKIHPSNLLWECKLEYLEDPDDKDFFIIPRYSKYCINKDGVLMRRYKSILRGRHHHTCRGISLEESLKLARYVPTRKMEPAKENTYLQVTIKNDADEDDSAPLHRLLGYVFLESKIPNVALSINHKNGLQYDNRLCNLEWVTYSQNNTHAKDENLCKVRISVLLVDIFERMAYIFKSITDISMFLKASLSNVSKDLDKKIVYNNKYLIVKNTEKEGSNFITIDGINYELRDSKELCISNVFAKDINTNKIFTANNYTELSNHINVSSKIVQIALASKSKYVRKGFIFGHLNEFDFKNKTFTTEEIEKHYKRELEITEMNKLRDIQSNPIIITNLDNNETFVYGSFERASLDFFNRNRGYLRDYFKARGNEKVIFFKNYKVEKVSDI